MIRACLLMLAGGYAAQLCRVPLSSDLCKLLLLASLVLLPARRSRLAGFLVLGFALFMLAGQGIVENRLDQQFAGDSLLTQVRIVDFPRISDGLVTLLVEPLDDHRLPRRSRVSWFKPPLEPLIGDVWEFELRLRQPRGYSNPGVFDSEAWLFRQEIHASGYVVSGMRNRRLETGTEGTVDRFRRQFIDRALSAADSSDVAAVLAAVGVGARHMISRDEWNNYAVSGTSHLMAISGLHIGLAASVAFLLARVLMGMLRVTANTMIAATVVAVFVAVAYTVVSGLGVPARRASVMLLVVACALIRRRPVDPFATVAIAAFGVFIADPVATLAPGFHLSFSAVVLLLWMARARQFTNASRGILVRVIDGLRQLFILQVFLLFGLMPLTVLLFQRVAILALPVNMVAVPLFSIVTVPFTLAGLACRGIADWLGHVALQIAACSIEWLLAFIDWIVRLPFADLTVADIQHDGWLLLMTPLLWALLPRGWPGRKVAFLAVPALLLYTTPVPDDSCVDVHVLDVGQGLATVVQTAGSLLVFDTGASFRSGGSVAEQVIVPFLKSRRIKHIDWLVVSHADNDHSGGVLPLYDHADVGALMVGEPLHETGLDTIPCRAGQYWQADGVGFRVLYPDSATPRQGNDASCVLLIEVGRHSLLLTGDIEARGERALVASGTLAAVDAVVVPHHGSLTSSSTPFVDVVSPLVAIVSAGYANRWGFPKEPVVARWNASGAVVLETGTSGAINFGLCAANGLGALRRDRHERRRFWRPDSG